VPNQNDHDRLEVFFMPKHQHGFQNSRIDTNLHLLHLYGIKVSFLGWYLQKLNSLFYLTWTCEVFLIYWWQVFLSTTTYNLYHQFNLYHENEDFVSLKYPWNLQDDYLKMAIFYRHLKKITYHPQWKLWNPNYSMLQKTLQTSIHLELQLPDHLMNWQQRKPTQKHWNF